MNTMQPVEGKRSLFKCLRNRIGGALLSLLLFAATAFGVGSDHGGAKYVFLFIGDGMGETQISAAELYSLASGGGKLALSSLTVRGSISTASANAAVTDSAAAGTALATGYTTNNGVLGMDPSGTKKLPSVAESARDRGMKVGIISSVFLNDATPAAFYASRPSRSDYYEIGEHLIESGFDYFAGGGINRRTGRKKDLKDIYERAREKGYHVLRTREELATAKPGVKIIATGSVGGSLPYDMDRPAASVSLAEFTKCGIELLDSPDGFFMMVEGGKIDWACHLNDAAAALHDILELDAAVKEALAFARTRPDETLIVVLADHETGGMSIDAKRAATECFGVLSTQRESSESFDGKVAAFRKGSHRTFAKMLPLIGVSFGLRALSVPERAPLEARVAKGDETARRALSLALSEGELDELRTAFAQSMKEKGQRKRDREFLRRYGPYEPLSVTITHILNRKAGISWSSFAHTAARIPVFAQGASESLFAGNYDNTDIARKLMSAITASEY